MLFIIHKIGWFNISLEIVISWLPLTTSDSGARLYDRQAWVGETSDNPSVRKLWKISVRKEPTERQETRLLDPPNLGWALIYYRVDLSSSEPLLFLIFPVGYC